MSPVVPVVAVLVVRSFPRGAVAVAARAAVRVSVGPPVRVVILVAMLVVGVMPVSLPRLVAVSWVHVLSVPLPVSSVWNTECFLIFTKRSEMCFARVFPNDKNSLGQNLKEGLCLLFVLLYF